MAQRYRPQPRHPETGRFVPAWECSQAELAFYVFFSVCLAVGMGAVAYGAWEQAWPPLVSGAFTAAVSAHGLAHTSRLQALRQCRDRIGAAYEEARGEWERRVRAAGRYGN